MKHIIAVALSGGIDSLASAYLLKAQGHRVIGIHFITGYETKNPISHLADQLGIDIITIDCSSAFQSQVVDYFIQTYQAGKTPNPCMVCNAKIKFGTILDAAKKMGASAFATGHYARIIESRAEERRIFHLLKGIDSAKDQSYFLAFLTQDQLSFISFPLGNMTKSEVRRLCTEKGLVPAEKSESQDVCFIKEKNYSEFLASQKGFQTGPGLIEDIHGKRLGEHNGLHRFTIGQRRGINCTAPEPYYVVRIDKARNCLVVGFKNDLMTSECKVININWICEEPTSPIHVYTRVRYRYNAVSSTLISMDNKTALIKFDMPQSGITPGQGAVFYIGSEVLGGGWFDEGTSHDYNI